MTTERDPFTSTLTKFKLVTSGTTMITRAPYTNGQYYKLRKVECTSTDGNGGNSGFAWKFWDQDLSSTTAGSVGSASHALVIVGAPGVSGLVAYSGTVPTTASKTLDQSPRIPFYAGITVQTNLQSHITLELDIV